ncbi:MAG: hypothetical protein QXM68_02420 [Candidatus Aenigmatarchaeota archaeon]|nr:hypothetical protein [Candidatus Aenigmarchaeota archaeon]
MKAQSAIEYIAIITIGLFILIPMIVYLNDLYISYRNENKLSSAKTAASKIVSISDWVFSQGEPAKNIIQVYIPADVEKIYFTNNSIIIRLDMGSSYQEVVDYSIANLYGNITEREGYYYLLIQAIDNGVNISVVS